MFPKGLYSIYDKVTRLYAPPFVAANDDDGIREFLAALQNQRLIFSNHPQDHQLFRIGEFHEDTGAIVAVGEVVRLHEGIGEPGISAHQAREESIGLQKLQAWLDRLGPEGAELRKRIAHGGAQ